MNLVESCNEGRDENVHRITKNFDPSRDRVHLIGHRQLCITRSDDAQNDDETHEIYEIKYEMVPDDDTNVSISVKEDACPQALNNIKSLYAVRKESMRGALVSVATYQVNDDSDWIKMPELGAETTNPNTSICQDYYLAKAEWNGSDLKLSIHRQSLPYAWPSERKAPLEERVISEERRDLNLVHGHDSILLKKFAGFELKHFVV